MTQPPTRHPQYAADHQTLTAAGEAPDWLARLRAQVWQQFNALGLPTARRGNERWKYTSIAPIARIQFAYPFAPAAAPELALELEEKGYDWIRPEMEAA